MTQRIGTQPNQAPTQKIADKAGVATGTGKTTEKLGSAAVAGAGTKTAGGREDGKTGEDLLEEKPGRAGRPDKADQAAHRRSRAIKIGLLALGLIVLAVAFVFQRQDRQPANLQASPGAGPGDSAAAKVGEVVEKANLSASVMRVNRNFTHPDPAIKPSAGNKFVVVEFKLTNKDPKAVRVSAARQFNLRDSKKNQYQVSPMGAPDPKFPDGTVAPGQTVSGWIAFQIPQDATGLRLIFNPTVPV